MVSRGAVALLECPLMLFVNYHHPQVFNWREDARTRTDYDVVSAISDLVPLIKTLTHREPRVLEGDLSGESACEALQRLRRHRDLRHHDDRTTPLRNAPLDRAKIDLSFPTARYAEQ